MSERTIHEAITSESTFKRDSHDGDNRDHGCNYNSQDYPHSVQKFWLDHFLDYSAINLVKDADRDVYDLTQCVISGMNIAFIPAISNNHTSLRFNSPIDAKYVSSLNRHVISFKMKFGHQIIRGLRFVCNVTDVTLRYENAKGIHEVTLVPDGTVTRSYDFVEPIPLLALNRNPLSITVAFKISHLRIAPSLKNTVTAICDIVNGPILKKYESVMDNVIQAQKKIFDSFSNSGK